MRYSTVAMIASASSGCYAITTEPTMSWLLTFPRKWQRSLFPSCFRRWQHRQAWQLSESVTPRRWGAVVSLIKSLLAAISLSLWR
jgi:hypothetical protein